MRFGSWVHDMELERPAHNTAAVPIVFRLVPFDGMTRVPDAHHRCAGHAIIVDASMAGTCCPRVVIAMSSYAGFRKSQLPIELLLPAVRSALRSHCHGWCT
jgi:hypothetical protein